MWEMLITISQNDPKATLKNSAGKIYERGDIAMFWLSAIYILRWLHLSDAALCDE